MKTAQWTIASFVQWLSAWRKAQARTREAKRALKNQTSRRRARATCRHLISAKSRKTKTETRARLFEAAQITCVSGYWFLQTISLISQRRSRRRRRRCCCRISCWQCALSSNTIASNRCGKTLSKRLSCNVVDIAHNRRLQPTLASNLGNTTNDELLTIIESFLYKDELIHRRCTVTRRNRDKSIAIVECFQ